MFCTKCGSQSPEGARFCARCGSALVAATDGLKLPVALGAVPPLQYADIRETLPPAIQKKLLPDEPAYAYVSVPSGCGSSPSSLLVTDTRVIVEGIDSARRSGCGSPAIRSLEIPIDHVSSVSEETVGTGCGSSKGVGISSGSAMEKVRVRNKKELEGALRIIQALLRAAHPRR